MHGLSHRSVSGIRPLASFSQIFPLFIATRLWNLIPAYEKGSLRPTDILAERSYPLSGLTVRVMDGPILLGESRRRYA